MQEKDIIRSVIFLRIIIYYYKIFRFEKYKETDNC